MGILSIVCTAFPAGATATPVTTRIFDNVTFYDGYDPVVYGADANDGILRHNNFQYAVRLTDDMLSNMGEALRLDVEIGARCDNYDRMGNISIALVDKGAETYIYEDVQHIEIARFVTPFMNKNKNPKKVPFSYALPDLGKILHDSDLRARYDFWLEAEVFGIPYAARTQVLGCTDRSDVFNMTVDITALPASAQNLAANSVLVPIYMKRSEEKGNINFNNYNPQACDTVGVATRTFRFNVPQDVTDSKISLIMTNHGAKEYGEEYERRLHLVYFDSELILAYTPGGESCEPYREYNTQGNFIYTNDVWKELGDEYWHLYSNWCPGQAVPTRELRTGALKAGAHEVMIRVPDATFFGDDDQESRDGDFRPSLYFQGVKEGELPSTGVDQTAAEYDAGLRLEGNTLLFDAENARDICIYSMQGELLLGKHNPAGILSLQGFEKGIYLALLTDRQGRIAFLKFKL